MDEPWYSSVSVELERVEKTMMDAVRSKNRELTEICRYVLNSNGKRVRPAMCLLSFYACGGANPRKAIDAAAALEIIHNATLVHDDINDRGEMRRGAAAAYKEFSIGKSIVAGDFMFALGYKLIGTSSPGIVELVVDTSGAMAAGEFVQKEFERDIETTEEDYIRIIEGKTAKLIECSAKMGCTFAGAEANVIANVGEFALRTGMAFQIVDDVLDINGNEKATGKRIGSDIMEGKPTLPSIYAMQDPVHGKEIRRFFTKQDLEWSEVDKAIALIKKTDAIPRCLEKARIIAEGSRCLLDCLDESEYKDSMLNLSKYIVDRNR